MKYTNYMPLINSNGYHFVLNGGWYEEKDGKIILSSGEICTPWISFPKATMP